MGILDDLKALTNLGGSATGEQHASTLSAIMEYINSPQVGGISGLQQKFQEKGLGGLVTSWIGSGQNLPISADQLQSVLHCGRPESSSRKVRRRSEPPHVDDDPAATPRRRQDDAKRPSRRRSPVTVAQRKAPARFFADALNCTEFVAAALRSGRLCARSPISVLSLHRV